VVKCCINRTTAVIAASWKVNMLMLFQHCLTDECDVRRLPHHQIMSCHAWSWRMGYKHCMMLPSDTDIILHFRIGEMNCTKVTCDSWPRICAFQSFSVHSPLTTQRK